MSLYTKYRPKDFDNLVGQNFIKETLKKAIIDDKTVWAYLFCWPRWTGKTSTARIFAKAVNCLNLRDWNPCLECENCKDFAEDKLIDIIEIDAASNTWVDNIRDLIEKAQFSPTKTKYKIYIIDEVHMLSKWAFNALLKILEEPPKHVKFILATTETHKVPETIISRCQRYDFKRINNEDIKKRLLFISSSENIEIDEESLEYIISSSNWWLRNAISLFEQLIEDSKIIFTRITEKLWISSKQELENFISKLQNFDVSVIDDFENIVWSWKNIKLFFKEIIFKIKDKIIEEIKAGNDISALVKVFEILDETYTKTKNSLDENTTFLVWILKIVWNVKIEKSEETPKVVFREKIIEKTKVEEKREEKIISNFEEEIPLLEPTFDLNESDLDDIFWSFDESSNEEKILETPKVEKVESKTVSNSTNNNFNSEIFIAKLKEIWAKWALTMSLRWSKISLVNDTLIINPNTKIARTNIEHSENLGVMYDWLKAIWFDYKIIIE